MTISLRPHVHLRKLQRDSRAHVRALREMAARSDGSIWKFVVLNSVFIEELLELVVDNACKVSKNYFYT